jgi:hypothetical protein
MPQGKCVRQQGGRTPAFLCLSSHLFCFFFFFFFFLFSLSLSLSLSLCAVCRGSLYIGTGADIDRRTQTKMTQTKQHGDDTDKETRGLDQDRHKRYTDKDAARHSDSKVSLKTNP